MNFNKKSVWVWVILFFVLLALAYGLGYYLYKNKSQINTVDWKTYNNDQYGYDIHYPKGWFFDDSNSSEVYISSASPDNQMEFSGEALSIKVSKAQQKTLLEEVKDRFGTLGTDFTQEKVEIDGLDGLKIKTKCQAVGCGSPEWVIINNGYFYHITSGLDYRPIFDIIVSTIKFTGIQNWQTYINSDFGFTFKYPKGVSIKEEGTPQKKLINVFYNTGGGTAHTEIFAWDIVAHKNSDKKELSDWFNSLNPIENKDCYEVESNINVENAQTILITSSSRESKCKDGGYYTISLPNKLTIIKWELYQDPQYFGDILPTFKFIQ